jgi:hypothetical protein
MLASLGPHLAAAIATRLRTELPAATALACLGAELSAAAIPAGLSPHFAAAAVPASLLGVAPGSATIATSLRGVAAAVTVTAAAMRTGRGRCGNRQGGHACGQNQPGHDKDSFVSGFQRRCGKARSCGQVRFICDEPHFGAPG